MIQLLKIAREKEIPVLITNQVYANFEDRNQVNMIGGDVIKYISKCILELKKNNVIKINDSKSKIYKAIIKKHRSIEEEKSVEFIIEETKIS